MSVISKPPATPEINYSTLVKAMYSLGINCQDLNGIKFVRSFQGELRYVIVSAQGKPDQEFTPSTLLWLSE